MDKERVFGNDFIPLNNGMKFNSGYKAIILEIIKPDIRFFVNAKIYTIPFRDFIVVTKEKTKL